MTNRKLLNEADRLFDLKNYSLALAEYEAAFSRDSGDVEARTGIALSLVHMGKYADAVPFLLGLLDSLPESEQLKIILAEALHKSGRIADAEACLVELVTKAPASIDAQVRLGRIYLDQEKYPEANDCFSAALKIAPDHVEALGYMGMMMIKFCQFDDALKVLFEAHSIDPANILILNNLGRACKMTGRHEEALKWYRQALKIEPGNACVIGNYLFALNYCTGLDPEYIAREHFRLAPLYLPEVMPVFSDFEIHSSGDRLKVGYVSGDFYTHSVSYFIEPVLQNHDYRHFEVFCYSLGSTQDATTERIKALPCIWRDMQGVPPESLAHQIRNDGIDILVDLSGHTADNRLGAFALRSAPVQASWIGYPNTSGLDSMDYYLTDSICDPPGVTDHLFSEKLWRLPRVFCCYLPPLEFPSISPLPLMSNGFVTFGSFNNFAKVTRQQILLWARMLRAVPDSRLYLKSMALGDASVKQDVLALFAAEGVSPERILMRVVTKTPLEHLQEYSKVDIALDTFPYNGTTTTCEALWMGTPVITLTGKTHVSRVGASLLHKAGCAEFAAESTDDYVELAVALALDPEKLMRMRENLRGMMAVSALMDLAGVTCEVEEAYTEMFKAACQKRNTPR